MPDEIVLRFSVKDDGSPVIERVNQKIKQTKTETKALAPGIENARQKMTDFISTNAGLIAVLTSAGLALKKLYDIAREGAQLEYTKSKFDRLSESIGTTSDLLLNELRIATRGTLSDFEAMALASDLLSLGLAKNGEEAVRLAKVQSGLGMDMNQLVLTLTNQTTMRFDALGVSVDGFEAKVKELEEQGYSTNEAFKEAFLRQAEMQLEKVGNAADESIGSFKRFEAQWKNTMDRVKTDTSEALAPFIDMLADGMEANDRYARALEVSGMSQREFNFRAQQSGMTINEYVESILEADLASQTFTSALENAGEQAVLTAEQLKEITKVNQNMLDLIGDLQSAEENYQEKYQDIVSDMNLSDDERISKLQELEAEHQRVNNEILSDLVERKLMQDGVLTDDEFEWLIKKRQEWGLYSAETVEKARAVWQEADRITQSINNIPTNKVINISMNYSGGLPSSYYASEQGVYRDSGGQGSIGMPHVVSPAASPEVYVPNQGGSFVPNADKNLIDYKKMARAIRDALNAVGG